MFNKTFLKFTFGFITIILVSFIIMVFTNYISDAVSGKNLMVYNYSSGDLYVKNKKTNVFQIVDSTSDIRFLKTKI